MDALPTEDGQVLVALSFRATARQAQIVLRVTRRSTIEVL